MNFTDENGCQLFVKSFLAGPYCAKCCWNLVMAVSANFLGISKKKGYLFKLSQIRRCSF